MNIGTFIFLFSNTNTKTKVNTIIVNKGVNSHPNLRIAGLSVGISGVKPTNTAHPTKNKIVFEIVINNFLIKYPPVYITFFINSTIDNITNIIYIYNGFLFLKSSILVFE